MSHSKQSKVEQVVGGHVEPADPVVLRQRALIEHLRSHGYSNPDMERLIGVGRPKPKRNGEETTGERIALYEKGKYRMRPEHYIALCAAVFFEGKVRAAEVDRQDWQHPTELRHAKLPLVELAKALGGQPTSRVEVRRIALGLQRRLVQRRRDERDQLVACVRELSDRLSKLLELLADGGQWTTPHMLFRIAPLGDRVQLDVSGAGSAFFSYRWDQSSTNPFDNPQQPLVYTQDEECPKERFQCLLAHLDECLRSFVISSDYEGSPHADEIRKLARSTRRATASLLRRMHAPRLVTWDVSHPLCVLDDQWWETHPNFSPVLICQRLPDGQDWRPLPESLTAQPILFGVQHNTPEKRCLRFLELMRDAIRTVRPDMMVDIGADLIGMDACKSLNLIARHGWI